MAVLRQCCGIVIHQSLKFIRKMRTIAMDDAGRSHDKLSLGSFNVVVDTE